MPPPPHTHTSSIKVLIANYLLKSHIHHSTAIDSLYKQRIS